ncbi:MAG: flagellar basal body P-ring formation chaperone FlgA [Synergistales bacterium]|nr:flagellar basal body P-ring formation chaperone FlgA [Synergistales bacterium]
MRRRGVGSRLLCRIVLIAFILSPAASAAAAPELTVSLPRRFTAREGALYLGEIARLSGRAEAVHRASLARVTPTDGAITRNAVIDALVRRGLGGYTVSLAMPEQVTVRPEPRVARDVRALSRWAWGLDVHTDAPEPQGRLTGPRSITPGTTATVLRYDHDGYQQVVPVTIRWTQPAPVALRRLDRGDIITGGDVALRFVLRSGLDRPAGMQEVVGSRAATYIEKGDVIYDGHIEPVPAVRRGEAVRIRARFGSLVVEARGESLQTATLGERVRVKNLASREVLDGTVVAPGVVLVEERE